MFECRNLKRVSSHHITSLYWSARTSCCLERSVARALHKKYSVANGSAAKGIMIFNKPQREQAAERQLLYLSVVVVG